MIREAALVGPYRAAAAAAAAPAKPAAFARRLPPAHTPLSFGAIRRAARVAFAQGDDPRPRFERLLCTLYDADDALLVDSGTHALELAIRLAVHLVGESAVVALPAYSCYDIATAAVGANARVTLYDVDPVSLAPDLDSLARALTLGATVVVVAPLYGVPVDWEAIERCAAARGALVIEDAAQGHGSSWHEAKLGSWGRLSVLSFGRGKGWTGGCGGALLARRGIRLSGSGAPGVEPQFPWRGEGLLPAVGQWLFGRPRVFGIAASIPWLHLGETRYHEPVPPRWLSRTATSLLENSMDLAARESSVRQANAAALLDGLSNASVSGRKLAALPVRVPQGGRAGYLRFPVKVADGLHGLPSLRRAAALGLSAGYPTTLAALPEIQSRMAGPTAVSRWPGAEELVERIVTLPTHSFVTANDRIAQLALLGA